MIDKDFLSDLGVTDETAVSKILAEASADLEKEKTAAKNYKISLKQLTVR